MAYQGQGSGQWDGRDRYDGRAVYHAQGQGQGQSAPYSFPPDPSSQLTHDYSWPPPVMAPYGHAPPGFYNNPPPQAMMPVTVSPAQPSYDASYGGGTSVSKRLGPPVDYSSGEMGSQPHVTSTSSSTSQGDARPGSSSRGRSDGHYREGERGSGNFEDLKEKLSSALGSKQGSLNLDALLKDERLKNVLFAGISKATAKLEQCLQTKEGTRSAENVAFLNDASRSSSSLFPSAYSEGAPQMPKSILKQKKSKPEEDRISSLSTLEKTLHLLRGKSNMSEIINSATQRRSQQDSNPEVALKSALGHLASYKDSDGALTQLAEYGADDEESYLYDDKAKPPKSPDDVKKGRPFWSLGGALSKSEVAKREGETFDIQDQLFQQWRQSINLTGDQTKGNGGADTKKTLESYFQNKIKSELESSHQPSSKKSGGEGELDSTVQNILQSIGFNFDLSKRMQELARKKKQKEDQIQTGIVNESASFLECSKNLKEEIKSSLSKRDEDGIRIENLIKEARANTGDRRSRSSCDNQLSNRSPSLEKLEMISSVRNRDQDEKRFRDQTPEKRFRDRTPEKRFRDRTPEKRFRDRTPEKRFRDQTPDKRLRDRTPDSRGGERGHSPYRSYEGSMERMKQYEKLEEISPERADEWDRPRRRRQHDVKLIHEQKREKDMRGRSYSRDRDIPTPPSSEFVRAHHEKQKNVVADLYIKERYSDGPRANDPHSSHVAERFQDGPKDEYFYPEDIQSTSPAMPLLTSFSSRKKNEDLSSGLFPSGRLKVPARAKMSTVENLRVTSQPVEGEDDSFTETRRIIMPAKSDRRVVSKSPSYRDSRSPEMRVAVKRSMSPLSPPPSKERKIYDERLNYYGQQRMQIPTEEQKTFPARREKHSESTNYERDRDFNPPYKPHHGYSPLPPSPQRMEESRKISLGRSPDRYGHERRKSPEKFRMEKRRSIERRRSISPGRRRSKSPLRRRSRSPLRRRSRSRSPIRRRRSPGKRYSPGRERRRSPYGRKTPPRIVRDKESSAKAKPSDSKYKIDRRVNKPGAHPKVDVSKMAPAERKAHLQKMLQAKEMQSKGQTVDQTKAHILVAVERLVSIPVDERKALLVKMTQMTPEERQKLMTLLSIRHAKVNELKSKLDRAKKIQNELMRKSQRSGLGIKDPELVKNTKVQENLEKEIARLSTADLDVPLVPPQPEEIKLSPSPPPLSHVKKEKMKASAVKAATELAKTAQKTMETKSSKGTSEEKKTDSKSQQNWTSVAVVKEPLPAIDGAAKKDSRKDNDPTQKKQEAAQQSSVSAKQKVYYEYYDAGNHWCRYCETNCNALEQFFQHCHGKKHLINIEHLEKPWAVGKKEGSQSRKVGQPVSRRTKGVQMMIPVVGFYCKLCKVFTGDLQEATQHVKHDSHYNKYMDYVQQNPMYEKQLLLEKTSRGSRDKSPPPLPPLPPLPPTPSSSPKTKKGVSEKSSKDKNSKLKSSKKHIRVSGKDVSSDEESPSKDNVKVKDMEIDDEIEDDGSGDVDCKVPKLTGKLPSVLPPLPPLSHSADGDPSLRATQEDEVQPLEKFVSIKQSSDKLSVVPVMGVPEMYLEDIPIPAEPKVPIPKVSKPPEPLLVYTVKSREETMNEEKRMMGINVDASEEKAMNVVPVAPPKLVENPPLDQSGENDPGKPKSKNLDSLFVKVTRSTSLKSKPKVTVPQANVDDVEAKIQMEITARLAREKELILKKKQKEENRKRKLEEGLLKKRKIYSDSEISSEESEDEDDVEKEKSLDGREGSLSMNNEISQEKGELSEQATLFQKEVHRVVDTETGTCVPLEEQSTGKMERAENVDLFEAFQESHVDTSHLVSLEGSMAYDKNIVEAVHSEVGENPEQEVQPSHGGTRFSTPKAKTVPKTKKKIAVTKSLVAKENMSDLTAFIATSNFSVSKDAQKKLAAQKSAGKKMVSGRGKKVIEAKLERATQSSRPEELDQGSEEDIMFGEGLIILSEVSEEQSPPDSSTDNIFDRSENIGNVGEKDSGSGPEQHVTPVSPIAVLAEAEKVDDSLEPVNTGEGLLEGNVAVKISDDSIGTENQDTKTTDMAALGVVIESVSSRRGKGRKASRGRGRGKTSKRGARSRAKVISEVSEDFENESERPNQELTQASPCQELVHNAPNEELVPEIEPMNSEGGTMLKPVTEMFESNADLYLVENIMDEKVFEGRRTRSGRLGASSVLSPKRGAGRKSRIRTKQVEGLNDQLHEPSPDAEASDVSNDVTIHQSTSDVSAGIVTLPLEQHCSIVSAGDSIVQQVEMPRSEQSTAEVYADTIAQHAVGVPKQPSENSADAMSFDVSKPSDECTADDMPFSVPKLPEESTADTNSELTTQLVVNEGESILQSSYHVMFAGDVTAQHIKDVPRPTEEGVDDVFTDATSRSEVPKPTEEVYTDVSTHHEIPRPTAEMYTDESTPHEVPKPTEEVYTDVTTHHEVPRPTEEMYTEVASHHDVPKPTEEMYTDVTSHHEVPRPTEEVYTDMTAHHDVPKPTEEMYTDVTAHHEVPRPTEEVYTDVTAHHEVPRPTEEMYTNVTAHHEVPRPTEMYTEVAAHHDVPRPTEEMYTDVTVHHEVPRPTEEVYTDVTAHHEVPRPTEEVYTDVTAHHEVPRPTEEVYTDVTAHHEVPRPTEMYTEVAAHHDVPRPTEEMYTDVTAHLEVPRPTEEMCADITMHQEVARPKVEMYADLTTHQEVARPTVEMYADLTAHQEVPRRAEENVEKCENVTAHVHDELTDESTDMYVGVTVQHVSDQTSVDQSAALSKSWPDEVAHFPESDISHSLLHDKHNGEVLVLPQVRVDAENQQGTNNATMVSESNVVMHDLDSESETNGGSPQVLSHTEQEFAQEASPPILSHTQRDIDQEICPIFSHTQRDIDQEISPPALSHTEQDVAQVTSPILSHTEQDIDQETFQSLSHRERDVHQETNPSEIITQVESGWTNLVSHGIVEAWRNNDGIVRVQDDVGEPSCTSENYAHTLTEYIPDTEQGSDQEMPYLVLETGEAENISPQQMTAVEHLQKEDSSDSEATITEEVEDPETVPEDLSMLSGNNVDEDDAVSSSDNQFQYKAEKFEDEIDYLAPEPVRVDHERIVGMGIGESVISLDMHPQAIASGQVRDPPMSGVVIDESSDVVMVPVNLQSSGGLASELSPTVGLGLGLEDEEDSIVAVVEDKMENMED